MYNILLYGNCQMEAYESMIVPSPAYCIFQIQCWSTEMSIIEFTNMIQNMDVIVMQNIKDNYREKHYLSSTYILNNSNPKTRFIFVTNLYFPYYYFDSYMDPKIILEIPYEYKSIKQYKTENKSKQELFQNVIFNKDFKSETELKELEDYCFSEFNRRYEKMKVYQNFYKNKSITIINVIPFIQQYFKHMLLFYSINHPAPPLVKCIVDQINMELGNILILNSSKDFFSFYKGILYSCLQKQLTFDISKCEVKIKNFIDVPSYIDHYYSM